MRVGGAKPQLRRQRFEYQLRSNPDRRFERTVDRAPFGKETMDATCGFPMRLPGFQLQDNVDPADHEHVVF